MKRWVLAAVLSCVALTLAYVPPRGARPTRGSLFFAQAPRPTAARERAQAIAEEWRTVEGSLQLLTARRQLRAFNSRSVMVVSESAGVVTRPLAVADSAARVAWRQLGLDETKIHVALVLRLSDEGPPLDRPLPDEWSARYLAPDSSDRTTCIAVIGAQRYWTRALRGDPRVPLRWDALVQSMRAGLGPCAFYAAYGTPGAPVRGWLAAKGWDLALNLEPGPRGVQGASFYEMASPRYRWYWDAMYSLPPTTVGCIAGRADDCRAIVVAGASDEAVAPVPDIVRVDRRWGHTPRLVQEARFLGDVAHSVGRDRFLAFWTTSQPVDTALAFALKRPTGEWTAEWERDFVAPLRLGPTAPWGATVIALVIAALAVALVAWTASRRQVR